MSATRLTTEQEDERRLARFTRLWEPDDFGRCFEWQGHVEANGYGRFRWSRERGVVWAHRASWEMRFGPIPDGLFVLHHCDNRRCIRPGHLFLGTQADNMADAKAKGRTATGDRSGPARREYGTHCKRGHERAVHGGHYNDRGATRNYCRRCHADRENARYHARRTAA